MLKVPDPFADFGFSSVFLCFVISLYSLSLNFTLFSTLLNTHIEILRILNSRFDSHKKQSILRNIYKAFKHSISHDQK